MNAALANLRDHAEEIKTPDHERFVEYLLYVVAYTGLDQLCEMGIIISASNFAALGFWMVLLHSHFYTYPIIITADKT